MKIKDEFDYIRHLEEVNAQLFEALVHLDATIMPEERKYDEWGYCRIHHDILCEFDAVVKEGIAAAKLEKES